MLECNVCRYPTFIILICPVSAAQLQYIYCIAAHAGCILVFMLLIHCCHTSQLQRMLESYCWCMLHSYCTVLECFTWLDPCCFHAAVTYHNMTDLGICCKYDDFILHRSVCCTETCCTEAYAAIMLLT